MPKKVYCLHHIASCPYYRSDCSCMYLVLRERGMGLRGCRGIAKNDEQVKRLVTDDPTQAILTGIARLMKDLNKGKGER